MAAQRCTECGEPIGYDRPFCVDLSLLWRTMLVLWRELNSEKGAKMMATLLRVNGDVIVVEPANGKVFTTSELQRLVGGFIEVVPQPRWAHHKARWKREVMLVDEDGWAKGLPYNPAACELAEQVLRGDALILTMEEWRAGQQQDEQQDEQSDENDELGGRPSGRQTVTE
jgi:hypothetical protein